jgi:hypothetical protein
MWWPPNHNLATRVTPAQLGMLVPSGPNSVHQTTTPPDTSFPTPQGGGTHQRRTRRHAHVSVPPIEQPPQDTCSGHGSGHPPTHRVSSCQRLLRKEVIQPHLPVRLPCYDFVPIASPTFDGSPPQGVGPPASGVTDFRDVTGGVYKARERIHRSIADLRLLATPTSRGRVADPDPN